MPPLPSLSCIQLHVHDYLHRYEPPYNCISPEHIGEVSNMGTHKWLTAYSERRYRCDTDVRI